MTRRVRQLALLAGCCTGLIAATPARSEACWFPCLFGHSCGYQPTCCYEPAPCCSPCSTCNYSPCSTCGYGDFYGGCSSCGSGCSSCGSGGCASGNCGVTYLPASPLEPAFARSFWFSPAPSPAITVVRQPLPRLKQEVVPVKYEAARVVPQRQAAPSYRSPSLSAPEATTLRARHHERTRIVNSNNTLQSTRHVVRTSVAAPARTALR
ncbi:MAG: hypothetical protein WD648_02850 [Planctomycetaceae bacterium]